MMVAHFSNGFEPDDRDTVFVSLVVYSHVPSPLA